MGWDGWMGDGFHHRPACITRHCTALRCTGPLKFSLCNPPYIHTAGRQNQTITSSIHPIQAETPAPRQRKSRRTQERPRRRLKPPLLRRWSITPALLHFFNPHQSRLRHRMVPNLEHSQDAQPISLVDPIASPEPAYHCNNKPQPTNKDVAETWYISVSVLPSADAVCTFLGSLGGKVMKQPQDDEGLAVPPSIRLVCVSLSIVQVFLLSIFFHILGVVSSFSWQILLRGEGVGRQSIHSCAIRLQMTKEARFWCNDNSQRANIWFEAQMAQLLSQARTAKQAGWIGRAVCNPSSA
ncbi:hypothetical protein B0H63DRAFT_143466 [Podospora didyma]|uniref:Uncharacterized protein n=1 Tax=Podospora didyma TaxID=330526 RepID=A0AAE0NSQ9_9PEZI|nr:hypothetical protein B0H63DRAFT_143466 [Podospora didyma]